MFFDRIYKIFRILKTPRRILSKEEQVLNQRPIFSFRQLVKRAAHVQTTFSIITNSNGCVGTPYLEGAS